MATPNRYIHHLRVWLLPLTLSALFALQNVAFNLWLHISPQPYLRMDAAAFALGMLIYGPSICLPQRWRSWYLGFVAAATSLVLVAEYLYFSYYGGFLQISAIRLTGEFSAIGGTIVRMLSFKLLFFAADLALVITVASYERFHRLTPMTLSVRGKLAAMLIVVAAVFGGYGTLYAAEKRDWGDGSRLYKTMYDLDGVVGKMGVVNYFLEDAAERAMRSKDVTDADRAFVSGWSAQRPAPSADGSDFGLAKGRNLIFIQVESLENAVIGTKLGGQEITPRLNALAKEGASFSNYYTQIGEGNTADAEFVTLDSLYPLPESVTFVDHAQNAFSALPKLLDDHGYHTQVFHGDVQTFWNRSNIYPNLGWQSWTMKDAYDISRPIGITGLGDQDFFEQTLPKLEALPQPFMASLITLSSHTPFILPDDLRTLALPADSGLSDTQAQYLESVHYTDRVLGDFIDGLKKSGLYDDSVIVIFGDHGSFTHISKALGVEQDDVDDMSDAQVPMIVLAPGTGLAGERSTPGSHLDVFPTVAHLLGFEAPKSVLGQDLFSTATPVVVHRRSATGAIGAIVTDKIVYAADPSDGQFEHGVCVTADTRQTLPVEDCRAEYEKQSAILRVSDTAIRGDMVPTLLK